MKYIITQAQYERLLQHIQPSKTAKKNICDSKKFCSAQGKITFGQLRELVKAATSQRLFKNVSEGGYKAIIRLVPWFLPQLALAGFVGSTIRALNKILRPTITETTTYKTWWGKAIMRAFDLAEGEINMTDPFSRIFFVSDGLMTMLDDKYKLKFAKYLSEIASLEPDNKEVPEFYVENELRKWLNKKFLLNPPLKPKIKTKKSELIVVDEEINQINKSYGEILTENQNLEVKIEGQQPYPNTDWDLVHGYFGSKRLNDDLEQRVSDTLNKGDYVVDNIVISTEKRGNTIFTKGSVFLRGVRPNELPDKYFTTRGSIGRVGSNYVERHDNQINGLADRLKSYYKSSGVKMFGPYEIFIEGTDFAYKQSFFTVKGSV